MCNHTKFSEIGFYFPNIVKGCINWILILTSHTSLSGRGGKRAWPYAWPLILLMVWPCIFHNSMILMVNSPKMLKSKKQNNESILFLRETQKSFRHYGIKITVLIIQIFDFLFSNFMSTTNILMSTTFLKYVKTSYRTVLHIK